MKLSPRQKELLAAVQASPGKRLVTRHIDWRQAEVARRLWQKMPGVFRYYLCGGAVYYTGCGMDSSTLRRLVNETRNAGR